MASKAGTAIERRGRERIGLTLPAIVAAALACLALAAPSQAATGLWESAWGVDVVAPGTGTDYEVCTVAGACKAGTPDTPQGGSFEYPAAAATAPNGDVWVANEGKNRLDKLRPDGQFLLALGQNVVAGNAETGFEVCTVAANCSAGSPGNSLGGGFQNVTGVAVAANGHVFAADELNSRIQEFTAAGDFVRTWGYGVNGGSGFEICTVAASCQGGGQSGAGGGVNSPDGIAVGPDGDVYVADVGNNRIDRFGVDGATVTFERAWGKDVDTGGGTGFEVCTVAAQCQSGSTGGAGGEMFLPSGIAVSGGDVFVADLGLRIQRFTTDGAFVSAWGKDVDTGGGTGFEVCTVAANCKAGVAGTGAGELAGFDSQSNPIAVSADGDVYVADSGANRVQVFARNGGFERMFGRGVLSGTTGYGVCTVAANCGPGTAGSLGGELSGPVGVATGIGQRVYVVDRGNGRVQKYADSSAPGPGFRFSSATYLVSEGAGSATITVQRTGDTTSTDRVSYATANGTATAAADYTGATGTLSFAAGETSKTFSVPITDDSEHEESETIALGLSSPSFPAQLGSPSAATLTIADNETGVDTKITSAPDAVGGGTARFEFIAIPSAGASFECRLDGIPADFAPCASPADVFVPTSGTHTFYVRAKTAGTPDPTPASKTFLADRVAPQAAVKVSGTKTASGAYAGTVTIDATATDAAPSSGIRARYCVVDPPTPPTSLGAFGSQPCGFAYSTPGNHTVYAIASDKAFNESEIASGSFRIAPYPETTITAGTSGTSYSAPTFSFTSSIAGSTFECKLDGAPYQRCTSSFLPKDTPLGAHTFTVRAVSPEFIADPTPAQRSFTLAQKTSDRSCSMEVPYLVSGGGGIDRYHCPTLRDVCPIGSVCTARLDVDATSNDFRYDVQAANDLIEHTTNAYYPSPTCDTNTSILLPGPNKCPFTETQTVIGDGKTFRADCFYKDYHYSVNPEQGSDEARVISCKTTWTVRPAPVFATSLSGTTFSTYVPGPGQVALTPAGGAALRTTAARRKGKRPFKAKPVTVGKAGPAVIALKLSKKSKKTLKRKHKLRLKARLSFDPVGAGDVQTVSKTLKLTSPVKPKVKGH